LSKSTGCELISNCIFTWGFTSSRQAAKAQDALWIDFKLYFYVRIHKNLLGLHSIKGVVNWFQIVFLREDSQDAIWWLCLQVSCELISNCIFTWGFTRFFIKYNQCNALWIDFKLYFYVRIHKLEVKKQTHIVVVNWFQIVFLREDSQGTTKKHLFAFSCELISNCIFTWGFTSTSCCL